MVVHILQWRGGRARERYPMPCVIYNEDHLYDLFLHICRRGNGFKKCAASAKVFVPKYNIKPGIWSKLGRLAYHKSSIISLLISLRYCLKFTRPKERSVTNIPAGAMASRAGRTELTTHRRARLG